MSLKLKRNGLFLAGLLVVALALVATGCGGDDGGEAPEALPSSSCTAIEYEGDGNPDYIVASDFPLQGASRTQTLQINDAIRKELADREYKAGDYNIGFQACDDATAQAGKWDSGKCSQNANAYAANDKVIGVIGTFNSGCAAIIIPVLNQAPEGGSLRRAIDHVARYLPEPATWPGRQITAIEPENFLMVLRRAQVLNAPIVVEPHDNPQAGWREFTVRDPDGYHIAIAEV